MWMLSLILAIIFPVYSTQFLFKNVAIKACFVTQNVHTIVYNCGSDAVLCVSTIRDPGHTHIH